jgi:glycosyltransferase involved in cell wall biosynthesis
MWRRSGIKQASHNTGSNPEETSAGLRGNQPTVIITGPPWPRSGTGRVMQSQIQFYRARGYETVFIADPFQWDYTRSNPLWDELRDGFNEFGADHVFMAAIEPRRFTLAKFEATLRHGRRGTALDWLVAIGRSAQLTREATRLLKGLPVALFHVNHVFTLGFALRLKRQLFGRESRIPMILDTHDIQSQMLLDKQEPNPWLRRPDRVERLLKSEISQLKIPDVLIHLSSSDFDFFRRKLPSQTHFLAFPTIDEGFISSVNEITKLDEPIDLLFVADWHFPNLSAIQWYSEQVWPLLAKRNYNVKVVGRLGRLVEGQAPQLYDRCRNWFVGEVGNLAPFYRSARCVIAPMVSGSGISIKTIEAFALGKAFVGTSKAFRGMPMEQLGKVGIYAFDEPATFANAIVSTLDNVKAAEDSSRMAYKELFSKEASFAVRARALAMAFKESSPAQQ